MNNKRKKKTGIFEKMIYNILKNSLKATIDLALDDILNEFKK